MSEFQPIVGLPLAKLQVCKVLSVNGYFSAGGLCFHQRFSNILELPRTDQCPNILLSGTDVNLGFYRTLTTFQNNTIYYIWLGKKMKKSNWNKFRNDVRSSNVSAIKQAWNKQ